MGQDQKLRIYVLMSQKLSIIMSQTLSIYALM